MLAYRIADRRRPLLDGMGAMLKGGRWNSPGLRVVYAAQTYAGAVLETLVHSNLGVIPRTQVAVTLHIPEDRGIPETLAASHRPELLIETLDPATLPGWNSPDLTRTRAFGDRWLREGRALALLVPSMVLQGREHNVLLNPEHPAFPRVRTGPPEPVAWDTRLFLAAPVDPSRP